MDSVTLVSIPGTEARHAAIDGGRSGLSHLCRVAIPSFAGPAASSACRPRSRPACQWRGITGETPMLVSPKMCQTSTC